MRRLWLFAAALFAAVPLALSAADPAPTRTEAKNVQRTAYLAPFGYASGPFARFDTTPTRGIDVKGCLPPDRVIDLRADEPVKDGKFSRGGKRSPGHKLAAAPRFQIAGQPPAKFAMIPSVLGMYGNDQYGDCVSAQEAVSLVAWTTYCGSPVEPTDAEVIAFARQHGLLNGADLSQVMDIMSSKGMTVGGKVYKDGGYSSVDYSIPLTFQSALCVGPVNVAIDANALPSGAGNHQGWSALGTYRKGQFPNTDHCVTFLAYGTVSDCYGFLKLPVPAGVDATQQAYVMDTWKTLGVVNQSWVMSTMEEAWVRNPTTVGFSPPAPSPNPTPTPVPPVPPVPPGPVPPGPNPPPIPGGPFTGTLVYKDGLLVGVSAGASGDVAADLKAAGVSPLVILDALKLIADLRAKAGMDVILADVLKLIADLSAK